MFTCTLNNQVLYIEMHIFTPFLYILKYILKYIYIFSLLIFFSQIGNIYMNHLKGCMSLKPPYSAVYAFWVK